MGKLNQNSAWVGRSGSPHAPLYLNSLQAREENSVEAKVMSQENFEMMDEFYEELFSVKFCTKLLL